MKSIIIAFTAVLVILYSCGVQHHQRQIKKHTERLKTKGIVIPKDTVTITKSDTVVAYFMRNDTIVERITITDTVTLEPTVEVKTRWQTRIEYRTVKEENKTAIDSLKQLLRIEKQQTKQTRIEHRGLSIWWLILLIGVFILYLLITNRR